MIYVKKPSLCNWSHSVTRSSGKRNYLCGSNPMKLSHVDLTVAWLRLYQMPYQSVQSKKRQTGRMLQLLTISGASTASPVQRSTKSLSRISPTRFALIVWSATSFKSKTDIMRTFWSISRVMFCTSILAFYCQTPQERVSNLKRHHSNWHKKC